MKNALCFLCGFTWVMALGAVLSLNLKGLAMAVLLLTPVVLLVAVLVVFGIKQTAQERRSQVFIYVPLDQREQSSGRVTRLYRPDEMNAPEQDRSM